MEWMPVNVLTPTPDKYHLFVRGNYLPFVGLWKEGTGCLVSGELCHPTHWMPLPEAPKEPDHE